MRRGGSGTRRCGRGRGGVGRRGRDAVGRQPRLARLEPGGAAAGGGVTAGRRVVGAAAAAGGVVGTGGAAVGVETAGLQPANHTSAISAEMRRCAPDI
jgi:hypothetical protein